MIHTIVSVLTFTSCIQKMVYKLQVSLFQSLIVKLIHFCLLYFSTLFICNSAHLCGIAVRCSEDVYDGLGMVAVVVLPYVGDCGERRRGRRGENGGDGVSFRRLENLLFNIAFYLRTEQGERVYVKNVSTWCLTHKSKLFLTIIFNIFDYCKTLRIKVSAVVFNH